MADRPTASLELRELSGFALRPGDEGLELVAASDEDLDLLLVPLGADGSLGPGRRAQLGSVLPAEALGRGGASEFEGVACDAAGRVVLLQEESARALVLSPALSALERAIDLSVTRATPRVGKRWSTDRNARGEGLLLMREGHLLVGMQKDPPALIEFGPPGDAALGVSAQSLLPAGGRFTAAAAPAGYTALGVWELDDDVLASVNDLAAAPDGDVLVLSASSRRIARLASPLAPGAGRAGLAGTRDLDLPGGARPEALAVTPAGRLLVGVDARRGGDVWVLDPGG